MESRIISERAFGFACRIVKLCDRMRDKGWASRKIADQLFDSGTSIGANVAESQGGQTKPDFLAKMSIARKESWETVYWLKLSILVTDGNFTYVSIDDNGHPQAIQKNDPPIAT